MRAVLDSWREVAGSPRESRAKRQEAAERLAGVGPALARVRGSGGLKLLGAEDYDWIAENRPAVLAYVQAVSKRIDLGPPACLDPWGVVAPEFLAETRRWLEMHRPFEVTDMLLAILAGVAPRTIRRRR